MTVIAVATLTEIFSKFVRWSQILCGYMDFFDSLRGLFGFSKRREASSNTLNDDTSVYLRDDKDERLWNEFAKEHDDTMGFKIFSNPLEMHRYFEKQMNDMLKMFGFHAGESSIFGSLRDDPFFEDSAGIYSNNSDSFGQIEPPGGNLRDYYLKPGYEHQWNDDGTSKSDSDIDGKVKIGDLDTMFNNRNSNLAPHQQSPRVHMYGQSITSKTIRNSDGTVEIHRSVRDQDGNEEATVTHKRGDQEYTVVTKTTKDGKKEITENLLNLSAEDVGRFLGNDKDKNLDGKGVSDEKKSQDWFLFNKYFK